MLTRVRMTRITKYTHSCVRLEHDGGGTLVIDPGIWSEPEALAGADAVLVTHEHDDHMDLLRLKGLGIPVYAPKAARIPGLDFTGVVAGEEFTAAGFRVIARGGRHARIYGELPDCANLGYLVEDSLYHPGDSLHLPGQPVETLLVPLQGSWLKTDEAIEFVRGVGPERAYGIHDGQINERGLGSLNGWLTDQCDGRYRWLAPGSSA
ncbi:MULTISPECIES: MBL fold metallo-hydrolase [Streptomyces]|uniref:MBL fold metallo-hydrolase n=1 Tax=Streptomyces lonegramiae TaxID=3075524 RepID=A0ABU2X7N2_9ACTN|nr:MBL fold metallo-hydrolase [Streptomyces sp. DSM 41529]MDT0541923.1 MBL fold metallo-hydrolase [Streptomyces sp. DSM 41529]